MDDAIESAAELIERAQLREVSILRVAADRRGSSPAEPASLPEELQAPDSPDDFAAIQLGTQLSDTELVVKLEVQTCNAYAGFQVDAEAIFVLPAPVALGKDAIVQEFTEKIGVTTVFPYLRAAVASLAAHVSVPASPLPLLPAGGMELLNEDEPSAPAARHGDLVAGAYTRTAEDGTTEQLGEFFIDAETGNLTRFGGEGENPDIDEFLKMLADAAADGPWVQIASADEETWQGLIREHGIDEVRALADSIRADEGDEAADGALSRIEAAARNISLEDAILALNEAVAALDEAVSAAAANSGDPGSPGSVPTKLLDAAAAVVTQFGEFRDL
ncbi:hypothetical protein NGTWS0302_33020 [Mycolicibacterium cyprinidarum]|uniref:Uncharacterized protein n=1 Tax=Mycolicibacterium cyprinidarum TaxID=2860311 RepID=A0ABQ4V3Y5_9MYCO|nr:hypothetical protein NGTWS1702_31830 [Mycolicibacterium sp. NGTWSNA01]GJF13123.1 hypothetical protein NGTWS0302_33020 [Mycolicibacterium sp. NGTWS0302]